MFFFGAIWLVTLLAGPFLLVLLLRDVVKAVTPPRGISASAACDRCGYAVTGLRGTMCPECGVDLMVSGIRTPALEMRRRGHLGWALLAWSVICGLGGMVGASIATMMMFSSMTGAGGATMATTTATVTSASGAAPAMQLTVSITTEDATGAVESTNVTLAPTSAAPGAVLTYFDTAGTKWTSWTDPSGRVGSAQGTGMPSAATISAWVATIRPAGAPALSDAEAQELADLIAQAAAGADPAVAAAGGSSFTVTGSMTTSTPTMSVGAFTGMSGLMPGVVMLLAGAVWVAGLVLIPVRRRSLRRRFGLTEKPARARGTGGPVGASAPAEGAAAPGEAG